MLTPGTFRNRLYPRLLNKVKSKLYETGTTPSLSGSQDTRTTVLPGGCLMTVASALVGAGGTARTERHTRESKKTEVAKAAT